jgi:hypothetical protein
VSTPLACSANDRTLCVQRARGVQSTLLRSRCVIAFRSASWASHTHAQVARKSLTSLQARTHVDTAHRAHKARTRARMRSFSVLLHSLQRIDWCNGRFSDVEYYHRCAARHSPATTKPLPVRPTLSFLLSWWLPLCAASCRRRSAAGFGMLVLPQLRDLP